MGLFALREDPPGPGQRTEIRRRLGYLPQDPRFSPNAKVFDVVDYLGIVKEQLDARARHAEVFRVLDDVGLADQAHQKVKTLWGAWCVDSASRRRGSATRV